MYTIFIERSLCARYSTVHFISIIFFIPVVLQVGRIDPIFNVLMRLRDVE